MPPFWVAVLIVVALAVLDVLAFVAASRRRGRVWSERERKWYFAPFVGGWLALAFGRGRD